MTHTITIAIGDEDASTAYAGRFHCDEPDGARCRLWCDEDHDVHDMEGPWDCEMFDQGYCLWLEGWFDDAWMWEELYDGPGKPDHDGEIAFTFQGEDGVLWHYADETPGSSEPGSAR